MYLEPGEAFSSVTPDEISARLPELAADAVQLVQQDYEQENSLLNEALQQGLEAYCQECLRLSRVTEPDRSEAEALGGEAVMVE